MNGKSNYDNVFLTQERIHHCQMKDVMSLLVHIDILYWPCQLKRSKFGECVY